MELDEKIARVPDRPGVYLYRDAKQQVLYVGKAASLRSRVRSYFQESRPRDPKTDALVRQIRDLEYIVTDNELEALMLEANLVRRHRPRYNIILRDDKHYPFLKLTTNEEFPRLVVARKVQHDGALQRWIAYWMQGRSSWPSIVIEHVRSGKSWRVSRSVSRIAVAG